MKRITSNAKPTANRAANPSGQPKKLPSTAIKGPNTKAVKVGLARERAMSSDDIYLGYKPSDLIT